MTPEHIKKSERDTYRRSRRDRMLRRGRLFVGALSTLLVLCAMATLPLWGWRWEVQPPAPPRATLLQFGADGGEIALKIDNIADGSDRMFALADSEAVVRTLWGIDTANVLENLQGLTECTHGVQSGAGVRCQRRADGLTILVPPLPAIQEVAIAATTGSRTSATPRSHPSANDPAPMASTRPVPAAPPDLNSTAPTDPSTRKVRSRTRALWLVSYVRASSHQPIYAHRGPLRIESATINGHKISATSCYSSQRNDNECAEVAELLGAPRLVRWLDAQRVLLDHAEFIVDAIAAPVIMAMLLWDVLLFLALMRVGFNQWLFARPLSTPGVSGQLLLASDAWKWRRRVLEWSEVMGPAVAFTATVLALMVAFDPKVFAAQQNESFAAILQTAMVATFLGLVMRVLSFSLDRAIDYASHIHADESGVLFKEGPQSAVVPLSMNGDSVNESAPQAAE